MSPTTLLSTIADMEDAAVTVAGRTWTVSPVDHVVLVRAEDTDSAPAVSLRRSWLAEGATLADVVSMALVEAGPREPVLSAVAAALLAGRVLLAPRVSCGRIHSATDPTPRWGCYRDPGGEVVTGDHAVPACEIGWHGGIETTHSYEPDPSPFGAAQAFVHEVGIAGARAALARHPAGCGACDPETPCPDSADAYGKLDAAEGDAGLGEAAGGRASPPGVPALGAMRAVRGQVLRDVPREHEPGGLGRARLRGDDRASSCRVRHGPVGDRSLGSRLPTRGRGAPR